MAIVRSTHSDLLSINNQHEYFTLRMPKGTFTMSYNGYKGTGITQDDFDSLLNFVDPDRKLAGQDVFKKFNQLLNPKTLKKIVPDWDVSSKPPKPTLQKIKRGQTVTVDFKAVQAGNPQSAVDIKNRYAIRGKVSGEVTKITAKFVTILVKKDGKLTNVKMPRTWVK